MFICRGLLCLAIVVGSFASTPSAYAGAYPGSLDRVLTARMPFPQSPCDYRSKRTGECVEGVDDNPVGASAECGDGLYSHSVTRSGTCSHHGGVEEWCPCGSQPSAVASVAAPQADADEYFLGLLSQIPNLIIRDPEVMTSSGRQVCMHLQNGDETRDEAIAATIRNTPNGTLDAATSMVDAAVSAYCPQLGG